MKFILLFFFTSFLLVDFLSLATPIESSFETDHTEESETQRDTEVATDPPCGTVYVDSEYPNPPPCNFVPSEGSRRWRCSWTNQKPITQQPIARDSETWKPCGFRMKECKTNCDYRTRECKTDCTYYRPKCKTTYTNAENSS